MAAGPRARGHRCPRRVRSGTRPPGPPDLLSTGDALRVRALGWTPLGRRSPTLADVDLDVAAGERVLLCGPSGSGKSTLLRALAGVLDEAAPGEATGEVVRDGSAGLLLQSPADAAVAATVGRDVAFGPENAGLPREQIWRRVDEALELVGLGLDRAHPVRATSGGQRQRVALAGVLALRPGVLLLDEPTSMLDDASARAVREAVEHVVRETGATLVVAEHRIGPWLPLVDRVVVLDGGRVVAGSPPELLARDHGERLVARGVWVPDVAAPVPAAVDPALVTPDGPPPLLGARDLHVELRARTLRGTVRTAALRGVDVDLPVGAATAFTGPSGAGKSTLVAALGGLVPPLTGRVVGTERPLHRWRSDRLARLVGWVPQEPEHGFLTRTVASEIAFTADRTGRRADVEAVAAALRLEHLLGADPYRLSGGEQRRLATAAALAHRPGVVLLDEPTVGQDRGTWAAVAGWASSAAAAGAAVAVATHDADLVAGCDREHRVVDGRLAG